MTEIMISNDLGVDVVYKLNRTKTRTDPCSTLNGRCCGQDSVLDMLILWCLSKKYDLN